MSAPITIAPEALAAVRLARGQHDEPSLDGNACLLEAASFLAGEPWSDLPQCVDTDLAYYGQALNDTLPDDVRQRLIPFIPRIVGTAGDGKNEHHERRWLSLDTLVRIITPIWLDAAGLAMRSPELRSLAPLVDKETARAAYAALNAIHPIIDPAESDTARVAERTVYLASAYANSGAHAGAFALIAGNAASNASVSYGAALARSRGLNVPQSSLDASDAALIDLLDRMIDMRPLEVTR